MSSRPSPRELCAAVSRQVGEPLFATASRVDLWLVLEVRGAWPDEVAESLDRESAPGRLLIPVLEAVPRSRVLFVKGAPDAGRDTLAFFVAVSDEAEPRLYRFELESYEAIEALDLLGVLAEDERYDAHRVERPQYLVCTHGTHDRCCAKFGFPTYRSLAHVAPDRVWQCSHIGGDRFAANLVCLPQGVYYGHVEPGETAAILESSDGGHLYLPRLRGRTCYASPVQAADYFLREYRQETRLDAYRLWSQSREGEVTEAVFLEPRLECLHRVRVGPAPLEGLRFLTCGSSEEKRVSGHRLIDYRELPYEPLVEIAGELRYHFRPAAMRDYGFIYRLRRDTLCRYLDEVEMPTVEQSLFFARFDVTRHRLICTGDTPMGAVSVLERETELHLANLHLLPAYQRRGLGSAIVQTVQTNAAASGRRMTTQVLKQNPARALYERLGFRIDGEQGLRYRMVWEP